MTPSIFRTTVGLLLVLTLANIAASFSALYAVRTMRDTSAVKLQQIEETTAYLSATAATLCARTATACPPPPERR